MQNESRNSFFLIFILSILLHFILVFALLLIQDNNHAQNQRPCTLHEQEPRAAHVIFQQPTQKTPAPAQQHMQPPAQPLPAPFIPLIEEKKKEPEIEIKKPMLLSGGDAAAQSAPPSSQTMNTKNHAAPSTPEPPQKKPLTQPTLPLAQQKPMEQKKEMAPLQEHEKKQPQPLAHQKPQEKPEVTPGPGQRETHKREHTTTLAPEQTTKLPQILEKPIEITQRQAQTTTPAQKKITLADIANGFLKREPTQNNGTGTSTTSNHVATVVGAPAGAATEEQLRYERYAVKLIACINNSFTILYPQLKYVHRPSVREANFAFVMDVNTKGDIVGLTVKQGSGNREFDDFMVKLLYHASRSFPPLPSYFKTQVCSFPILCTMPTGVA